jgi:hypothetical protein
MLTNAQKQRILSGLTYNEYSSYVNTQIENFPKSEILSKNKYDLLRLNNTRSRRIDNTFMPDEEVRELLSGINKSQIWLMITEPWCGDSAQNIPYINKMAELNPLIDLRLILRDENPDIMDLYLTGETRSIPILISFDEEWNELFRWGSRPKEAADLVKEIKNSGACKEEIQEKLHRWYATNKGAEVTREMCEILRSELASEVL